VPHAAHIQALRCVPVPNAALTPNAGFMSFMEPADGINAAK
jgi:hypothetical protein